MKGLEGEREEPRRFIWSISNRATSLSKHPPQTNEASSLHAVRQVHEDVGSAETFACVMWNKEDKGVPGLTYYLSARQHWKLNLLKNFFFFFFFSSVGARTENRRGFSKRPCTCGQGLLDIVAMGLTHKQGRKGHLGAISPLDETPLKRAGLCKNWFFSYHWIYFWKLDNIASRPSECRPVPGRSC